MTGLTAADVGAAVLEVGYHQVEVTRAPDGRLLVRIWRHLCDAADLPHARELAAEAAVRELLAEPPSEPAPAPGQVSAVLVDQLEGIAAPPEVA